MGRSQNGVVGTMRGSNLGTLHKSLTARSAANTPRMRDFRLRMQVRVQAGARVQDVVEALRPHGLTLQNYASVREQQVGGLTQVSAHGTGASLPPVDEQLVALRLVSPGSGAAVELRRGEDAVFDWVKVGLGAMGVVTEVTLQCVDAHKLLEKTFVATRDEVRRSHKRCAPACVPEGVCAAVGTSAHAIDCKRLKRHGYSLELRQAYGLSGSTTGLDAHA